MSNLASILPTGWKLLSVKDAFAIRNNLRKPISQEEREKIKGEYPYYGPTKAQGYISSYEQDGKFALIGEDGDHFLKYQNISMTQLISGKCTVNNHAHVVEGTEICTAEWFYYFFMHKELTSFLTRQGAGRFKLNKASLEKIPVLAPPVAEQTKIAKILSTWDKTIATSERLLANSQQQKQALMQQLLTGQKRFAEFTEDWKHYALGQLFSERNETNRPDLSLLSITTEQGVIDRADSGKKDTSSEDKSKYRRICPGDIGYNTMRMWQGVSGLSDKEGIVSPAYTILQPTGLVDSKFASYLFKTPTLIHVFMRHSQGLVSDTWNLKYEHFAKIKVSVPCVAEQQKIAQVLSTADAEIANLQAQLAKFRLEKKALMQQLLTGQRRVRLDDEAAA